MRYQNGILKPRYADTAVGSLHHMLPSERPPSCICGTGTNGVMPITLGPYILNPTRSRNPFFSAKEKISPGMTSSENDRVAKLFTT